MKTKDLAAITFLLLVLLFAATQRQEKFSSGYPQGISIQRELADQAMQRQRESEEAIRQSKLAADERYKIDMERIREAQRAAYYASKEQ